MSKIRGATLRATCDSELITVATSGGGAGPCVASVVSGFASVACFAVGLGADTPTRLMRSLLIFLVATVVAIDAGAKSNDAMAAGAGAIALGAILAITAYSFGVCGAVVLDKIS